MLSRFRKLYDWLGYRSFMVTATMYLAAASLIGFETLAVLIGYATIWPVGIPIAIMAVGVYAVMKRRYREHKERRATGLSPTNLVE